MSTKCVINVDLADVWGEADRKKFLRTLAWGDEVSVTKQTSTSIEIETVYFNEQPDGSILPVKEAGFIEPGKSSGIKTADVVRAHNQNDVLKVNCVDVQQGDGAVIESPDGKVRARGLGRERRAQDGDRDERAQLRAGVEDAHEPRF